MLRHTLADGISRNEQYLLDSSEGRLEGLGAIVIGKPDLNSGCDELGGLIAISDGGDDLGRRHTL
jgi:hypothetical protein